MLLRPGPLARGSGSQSAVRAPSTQCSARRQAGRAHREARSSQRLCVSCDAVEQGTAKAPPSSGRGPLGAADVPLPPLLLAATEQLPINGAAGIDLRPPEDDESMHNRLKRAGTAPALLALLRGEPAAFGPLETSQALHLLARMAHPAHPLRGAGRVFGSGGGSSSSSLPSADSASSGSSSSSSLPSADSASSGSSGGGDAAHSNGAHSNGAASSSSNSGGAPDGSPAPAAPSARADAVAAVADLVARHGDEFDPMGVALGFWSLGTLDCHHAPALDALCRRAGGALRGFAPIDCAQALVGWARLRVRTRPQRELVDALIAHTLDTLSGAAGEWRPQELASVAWALSRVGVAGLHRRAILETLMDVAQWKLDAFNVQELTTLVYAYARMHHRMPSALLRISGKLSRALHRLGPQDAAMLLWGCARLGFRPPPSLLDALPGALAPRVAEFSPAEISALLYGFGALRAPAPALFEAAAAEFSGRLSGFSSQELSMTVWAFGATSFAAASAAAGRGSPRGPAAALPPAAAALLDAAAAALLARRRRLLPAQIAMAAKALARCGHAPPPGFMDEMASLSLERLPAFKPIEMCHLLWAYASLGYRDTCLFEGVVGRAVALLQSPSRPPLSKLTVDTIVWASQRVGFWPQALIDTAEMRGIYVGWGNLAHGSGAWTDDGGEAEEGEGEGEADEGAHAAASAGGGAAAEERRRQQQQWQQEQQEEEPGDELDEQQQQQRRLFAATDPAGAEGDAAEAAVVQQQQGQRRPPPQLSLHRVQQRAQVARHQIDQQRHSDAGDPPGPGAGPNSAAALATDARTLLQQRQQQQQQQQRQPPTVLRSNGRAYGAPAARLWGSGEEPLERRALREAGSIDLL
ncbi:hypothetical protein Rsub_13326 [Raphidocelis subcapitata]|uniref:RNA-editing substrate-binding complex 6 protein domain-containing protein n=1 Tax=Raphidocelis subcapitata TaxID=307507 RepID=A0A2V0PR52_9CHLO|nr:hypothetical protein Rsub_13326 [Raphidocelis subcapitata]|eukprot:GBG00581.1 hypothetical protein Rsub_13326 [Raphidocelis subcapitata]